MSLYRLLRDNKETGPFTGEELLQRGFKPYDLLWVEGKSAGWRYPGEIAEFKDHVPMTEEQPYDRFYKKPQAEQPSAPVPSSQSAARKVQAGKHIHVTLPSGTSVNVTTIVKKKEPAPQPAALAEALPPQTFSEAISRKQEPRAAHAATSFAWTSILGLIVGVAAMVGLGVMIGMSISRDRHDIAFRNAIEARAISQPKQIPAQAAPAPAVEAPESIIQNTAVKEPAVNPSNQKPLTAAPASRANVIRRNVAPDLTALSKQVTISSTPYKVGAFGGITDVQCVISNRSKFQLASVEVELSYIQANEKVFKTERLSFTHVSPGAQLALSAPKSSRGVKVVSRILHIRPASQLSTKS